jgi:hypothetical protein
MSVRFTTLDYLSIASCPSDPWTMVGWCQRAVDTNDYAWVFGGGLVSGSTNEFLGVYLGANGDILRFAVGDGGAEDYSDIMTPAHPGWFFTGFYSNGMSPVSFCADEVDTSLTTQAGSPTTAAPACDQIVLGDDDAYGPGEDLNGRLVGVKVWDAALSQAECWAERFTLSPRRLADLWAWWPLLAAGDYTDYSGNGRDLSVKAGTFVTEGNAPVSWGTPISVLSQEIPDEHIGARYHRVGSLFLPRGMKVA